jgi:hypothetical protein
VCRPIINEDLYSFQEKKDEDRGCINLVEMEWIRMMNWSRSSSTLYYKHSTYTGIDVWVVIIWTHNRWYTAGCHCCCCCFVTNYNQIHYSKAAVYSLKRRSTILFLYKNNNNTKKSNGTLGVELQFNMIIIDHRRPSIDFPL